jgi:uncharacterized protein (AIM24 family)
MAGYGQIETEGRPLLQMVNQDKDGFAVGADPSTVLNSTVVNRPAFAHARVDLVEGTEVVAAAGAMLWMDGNIGMSTSCYGGCCAAIYRGCSGQTVCMNKWSGTGEIAFGFDLPGDMLPFAVTPGQGWIISAGSFICGTTNAIVTARWSGCLTCLCGGEGAFMTKVYSSGGNGLFYAGGFGQLQRHEVPEGKTLLVNNGLFFAANEKTHIELGLPGSCSSWCWGKEGFCMKFHGPAVVYTQNRDPVAFMRLLNPLPVLEIPDAEGQNGAPAAGALVAN